MSSFLFCFVKVDIVCVCVWDDKLISYRTAAAKCRWWFCRISTTTTKLKWALCKIIAIKVFKNIWPSRRIPSSFVCSKLEAILRSSLQNIFFLLLYFKWCLTVKCHWICSHSLYMRRVCTIILQIAVNVFGKEWEFVLSWCFASMIRYYSLVVVHLAVHQPDSKASSIPLAPFVDQTHCDAPLRYATQVITQQSEIWIWMDQHGKQSIKTATDAGWHWYCTEHRQTVR